MTLDIPNIVGEQDNKRWDKADDNVIQTFQIETSELRGRLVRLGSVLDDVLRPHDYPAPVAQLVAETMTLAILLSSMLKYEGIFTLQTKGDGPISMLVADVTTAGDVRACASFDPEKLAKVQDELSMLEATEGSQNMLAHYLGKGYIAFTVDQGANTETYQGIVELRGHSLMDCVHHYFNQSEQIGTGMKIAAAKAGDHWRAGGIMIQRMPSEGGILTASNVVDLNENDWRHAMVLMGSCKDEELISPDLHSNELLLRLFHEDGVRVYKPVFVQKKCRCNADKIKGVLVTMSEENIDYLSDEGQIKMNCEFCNTEYVFEQKDLLKQMKISKKDKEN